MSDFYTFFVRFLPDLLRGAGITLLLTVQGLSAGFVLQVPDVPEEDRLRQSPGR